MLNFSGITTSSVIFERSVCAVFSTFTCSKPERKEGTVYIYILVKLATQMFFCSFFNSAQRVFEGDYGQLRRRSGQQKNMSYKLQNGVQ